MSFKQTSITLTRAMIQELLQSRGSKATTTEFLNEEDGQDYTESITISYESLNARLKSLGAHPISQKFFSIMNDI
jgi:hypothetical protein